MKRSELHLLISLDALLAERNVTRAAGRLNISQSTLSGHLGRLRELFNDPLLVPSETGRGMAPTDRALALAPLLAEALAGVRSAVAEPMPFEPARSARTFVVAANDSVFTILGLEVMAQVMGHGNPGLRMAVVPASGERLVERMASGEVDLYLGDVNKVPPALKSRFLLSDGFMLAQRKKHPRGTTPPTLGEYTALSHVVVSASGSFSTPIDTILTGLGARRQVLATVPNYNQVALILARTDGVATLPRQLLRRYEDLIDLVELPFEVPSFDLAMAWHPRAQQDPAVMWLRTRFLEQAAAPRR